MHELSIAQNILQIVSDSVEEKKLGLVDKIYLKLGLLSNILTESLIFSFSSITENTPLENANLEIEIIPLKIKCGDCKKVSTTNDFVFSCPYCKSSSISLIGGNEMIISSIHLKDEREITNECDNN